MSRYNDGAVQPPNKTMSKNAGRMVQLACNQICSFMSSSLTQLYVKGYGGLLTADVFIRHGILNVVNWSIEEKPNTAINLERPFNQEVDVDQTVQRLIKLARPRLESLMRPDVTGNVICLIDLEEDGPQITIKTSTKDEHRWDTDPTIKSR